MGESSAVQDLGFRFDSLGNLTRREDLNQEVYESFSYDRLNRLTGGIVYDADDDSERETKTYRYDAVGNIVNKSDVGAADYVYGSGNAAGAGDAGPHAVVSAGGNTYAYDDNGNMISGDGRTLTWTSFNKPKTVVNGSTSTRFDYGPERARIRQVRVQGAVTTTIKYVGTLFEQIGKTGAATEYVHYVFAGERRVAVYSKDNAPTPARVLRYLHQDHLGSVDTITDESGAVVERLSYDAWGKRRVGSGEDAWKDSAVAIAGASTPRGFTDHEHLDDFELVHMNGRVYEPLLGRFLSPDPLVQYPESTQGFNRYTYVSNNPLSLVDPTGYEDDEYDNWEDSTPDFDDGYGQDSGLGGPSTDGYEDGQANCPCHPGNAPLVSNPATGGSIPPTSGSPQGVNQAGRSGGGRGGMFSDYWDDVREDQRIRGGSQWRANSLEEFTERLPPGWAVTGKRPIKGYLPLVGEFDVPMLQGSKLDAKNKELAHEHVFWNAGRGNIENSGFFREGYGKGRVREGSDFPRNVEDFVFEQPYLPSQDMQSVVDRLTPHYTQYNTLGRNCQVYAEDVRRESQSRPY